MQDEVFYGNFWKRYPSEIFDRVQKFILMFFIITCIFPKAASKPASVFHPMLPGALVSVFYWKFCENYENTLFIENLQTLMKTLMITCRRSVNHDNLRKP